MQAGQLLQLRATDPSTQRDIPKFCAFLGHELIEQRTIDRHHFEYLIRKGAG
jgi:tRNA 2-thiouridine synthesizing protein A